LRQKTRPSEIKLEAPDELKPSYFVKAKATTGRKGNHDARVGRQIHGSSMALRDLSAWAGVPCMVFQ
jgi:hypothetical protein